MSLRRGDVVQVRSHAKISEETPILPMILTNFCREPNFQQASQEEGFSMELVQRVVQAGRPINAEQLRLMLDGCNIRVTQAVADRLYRRYGMPWIAPETIQPGIPHPFHPYH